MSATRKRHLVRLVAAILLAVFSSSSGCSVVTTIGTPLHYEPSQGPPRCMRVPVGPMVDFAAVLPTYFVGGLIAWAEGWGSECEEEPCTPVDHSTSSKFMLAAGALLLSGVYGAVQTSRCRDAYEHYRAYRESRED